MSEPQAPPDSNHPIRFAIACSVAVFIWAVTGFLESRQRATAAIFAFTVLLWMTEALPLAVTALLSTTLLVVSGALPYKEAFATYGDQIILLFVGSFILALSMEDSGLDRRTAYWMLSRPWAGKSASAMLFALGLTACLISLFVSNTATTAMMLPIGLTILKAMGTASAGHPVTTSVLLMLTWGSSVAVGTIIGTPPNVIGVGMIEKATGTSINFVQWAAFGMPVTLGMLLVAWIQLRVWPKGAAPDVSAARALGGKELKELGPMRASEKITLGAFLVALFLWLLPGGLEYGFGKDHVMAKAAAEKFPEAVAALIGVSILFLLPCKDKPEGRAMTWKRANQIEWGTILLFAGGLALGAAVKETKLAELVGKSMASTFGLTELWGLTALCIVMGLTLSELASNTASTVTIVPVAISLAEGAGVNPIPCALGAIIAANLGFMLPISTAPNAIVYSTRLVPAKTMLRAGIVFDIVGALMTWGVLRVTLPMMGLA